jgi:antitoxin component YwqK of YwqJK toxin-antitoxin module
VKHGQWKQYFENGKIKSEGTYEDGFWEGKLLRHHETGYKAAEGQYKKGVMEGDWMYYTNQGQPTFLEIYRNGVVKKSVYYNGEFEEKYPDDIPKWVYNYKNGKKHGAFREYYHQGSKKIQVKKGQDGYPDELKETYVGLQVRMEGNYSNDLLEGPVKHYKPDGKLEKTEIYKQGKLIETK